jgi:hypothetical protein
LPDKVTIWKQHRIINVRTSQERIQYYDLTKNWPKIKRHLADKELNDILVEDFDKFTLGRWGASFWLGRFPSEFESLDWKPCRAGRRPAFWKYTCGGACHWLVNFALRLAMLVEPRTPWRIVTSSRHSTVWDRANTVFDFNWQAMGIDAAECLTLARKKELQPGQFLKTYFALDARIESVPGSVRSRSRNFPP